MDTNNNDYVLVLEDHTAVKSEQEVGKLSVVTELASDGKLKTAEAGELHQASFLKFNSQDGLLKNFMTNFLKQFNAPARFGLYKVVASNTEQGVENLRASLQNRQNPATQELIKSQQVALDDFLPRQQNAAAIDPSKIDWKMLEDLGLSRERLEASGELDKMLNWQKSDLVGIAVPYGNSSIYTEARLAFRTDDEGNISLAVHAMRKEPQLDFPYGPLGIFISLCCRQSFRYKSKLLNIFQIRLDVSSRWTDDVYINGKTMGRLPKDEHKGRTTLKTKWTTSILKREPE